MVNADKQDLLSAIQLLQPLTMSWSNVPDYWEAEVCTTFEVYDNL